MGFIHIRNIPGPEEIKEKLPLSIELKKIKAKRDKEISSVLTGKNSKFILIIGPCSAHDEDAVCEYVKRLSKIQEATKEKLIIIPRIYTNKPRTTGKGYKGMLHQPDHLRIPNISEGIFAVRRMHKRALEESHLSAADEMLYPQNHPYLDDILSYIAVGARSVEDQQHRLTASGVDIPVGMKNPTSGNLVVLLNSIQAAQEAHIFTYNGFEVKTTGNNLAHAILRGAINPYGQHIPNYHYEELMYFLSLYEERNLANPAVLIDTNHDNSGKKYEQQPRIASEVIQIRKHSSSLRSLIKGLMIESFLLEGNQNAGENTFGKSITDPCLGWEESVKLIEKIAEEC